jgi:hypothetical protein
VTDPAAPADPIRNGIGCLLILIGIAAVIVAYGWATGALM